MLVIFEDLSQEAVLLQNSHVLVHLSFHHGDSPELVSIWVLSIQVLVTVWHGSWLIHRLLVLFEGVLVFLLDDLGLLLLVIARVIAVEVHARSLLPVLEISLIVV